MNAFLWCLCVLLVLLLLPLFLRIHFFASYTNKALLIYVRLGIIRINIYPLKPREDKEEKQKKPSEKEEHEAREKRRTEYITTVLSDILPSLKKMFSRMIIDILDVKLVISTGRCGKNG